MMETQPILEGVTDTQQPIFIIYKDNQYTNKMYRTREDLKKDAWMQLSRLIEQLNKECNGAQRDYMRDVMDAIIDYKLKFALQNTKLFGYHLFNQSLGRVFGTVARYKQFIIDVINVIVFDENIWEILKQTFHRNLFFTLIGTINVHNKTFLTSHSIPYNIVRASVPLTTATSVFCFKIVNRLVNRNLGDVEYYVRKCFKLDGTQGAQISLILFLYKLTFLTWESYYTNATFIDFLWFLIVNQPIFSQPLDFGVNFTYNNEFLPEDTYDQVIAKNLYYFFRNYVLGGVKFILSGGESNPGPILDYIKDLIHRLLQDQIRSATQVSQETMDMALMSAHLMRLFTSLSDTLGSLLTIKYISAVDFTTRLASLALNVYESHKLFGGEVGFRLRPIIRAQGGPMESLLIGTLLSYGTPAFIRELLKEMPRFTNVKILDDASWFYDLFGFIISIPRKLLSLFEDEGKTGYISIITSLLLGIEDLFPFSSICRVKKEMEVILNVIQTNPNMIIEDSFHDKVLKLDAKRKGVEALYNSHKKVFPGYYANTSTSYDNLVIDVLKYKSDVRVEPVCIIFKGPKGTGKTVLMNRVVQMYKNAGMKAYMDNIPASLDNKKFYDSYKNEEIYVVDDMGAKSKAQWSEIINQVSSTKYPLEAARIENKNTKFFNSQLMLLTCNILPTSFGTTDGVADIEAFYRRLIIFEFENVKFFDGKHTGEILVQRFDDTLGVKRFVTIEKFVSTEEGFNMVDLDVFISRWLKIKMDQFLANKNIGSSAKGTPFPKAQGLTEDIIDSFNSVLASMPGLDVVVGHVYDLIAQAYDSLQELKSFSLSKHKNFLMFTGLACLTAGVAIYYTMKEKSDRSKLVKEVSMHYKSGRTEKGNLKRMLAQGFINLEGEITQPVPQLIPYQNNVAVLTFSFQKTNGKSATVKVRGLVSQDRIMTVFHIFGELDQSKPIYVTIQINKNILYDYMEVNVLANSAYDDWIVLRLPETCPTYFKKLNMSPQYTSTQLYLAVGNSDIVDLGADITQYDYGVGYEYDNYYKGNLSTNDLMYNIEGDGLCGSLLLTKDGCILGMHTAAVEYEIDGVTYSKGITKLFSEKTYNFVIGLMTLGLADKVNLEVELKERELSGVYINTDDRCYGYNGTKYVKSPIHGVFPVWRKPALWLPEDKQDYKMITEQMMKPAGEVNLQAMEFCDEVLSNNITDMQFPPMGEREIVKGNDVLNRIDPQTSAGHSMKFNDKNVYLDIENGKLTDTFLNEFKDYTDKIVMGKYDFSDCATVTSKDELKNVPDPSDPNSMPSKIRVFTNYHLISTILFRYFFGELMCYVMQRKFYNGIMIGINPLSKQWDKFTKILSQGSRKCFDGDYANYDRNMHPVFQRHLNTWLYNRVKFDSKHFNKTFKTNYTHREVDLILRQILECIISTPVQSKNKKFITTHGLPSGTALTAFYNSCINMMYASYVYRMKTPIKYLSVHDFVHKTSLFYYGDDIIGNVSEEIKSFFNPISFSEVMKPLGLDFTPAEKDTQWTSTNQFKDITECTFLKRGFYLHPKIKSIVAPLDIRSMEGTMNFVTDKFRSKELVISKFYNFQRECFLHPPSVYESNMKKLLQKCEERNIRVVPLTENYLIECYNKGEYGDLLELN